MSGTSIEGTWVPKHGHGRMRPKWRKGEVPNPTGRPKGPRDYIRAQTANGEELVQHALAIMRSPKAPWTARTEARRDLMAYLWGRPPQYLNVTTEQPIVVYPPAALPPADPAAAPPSAASATDATDATVVVEPPG